jgi:hypothetical protein
MTTATGIRQLTTACLPDIHQPAQLALTFAKYGDANEPVRGGMMRRGDPLFLLLQNVEPGCKLQVLNLSRNPEADWDNAADVSTLPGDTWKQLEDGRYGLILGNDAAQKTGIRPGDYFEIRQLANNGKASNPIPVALDQKSAVSVNLYAAGTLEQIGVQLTNTTFGVAPYADASPPLVLDKNLQIEASEPGKAFLRGRRAIEPRATVFVRNEVSHEVFQTTVKDDRTFELPFKADVGHPLHVWVTDPNGQTTDLGMTPYAPSCVKAGPCAMFALQAKI